MAFQKIKVANPIVEMDGEFGSDILIASLSVFRFIDFSHDLSISVLDIFLVIFCGPLKDLFVCLFYRFCIAGDIYAM